MYPLSNSETLSLTEAVGQAEVVEEAFPVPISTSMSFETSS